MCDFTVTHRYTIPNRPHENIKERFRTYTQFGKCKKPARWVVKTITGIEKKYCTYHKNILINASTKDAQIEYVKEIL